MFTLILRAVGVVLSAITVAALPLLALFMTGRGPIRVAAFVKAPYSVGFSAGRVIEVAGGGRVGARVNFPIGEEARSLKEAPRVLASVRVDPDDTDTRTVLSLTVLALIGLVWVGFLNLRGVVGSALRGDPFVPANAVRLRWLAAAVLAVPLVTSSSSRLLSRTLDADPAVAVASYGPSWWAVLVIGFGLVALAEVFRAGSHLRAFERETV